MSRNKETSQARDRARQAAAQLKPVAAQVKPLASSAGATAKRGARRTRTWAAPQVERAGQVLEHSVAPKVSALLSSAARRLDPGKPRHARWRTPAGLATVTATACAAAAYIRHRGKTDSATATATAAAGPDGQAPAGEMRAGQATTSVGTDADREVRTP
jgi:hypothetical protein